MFTDRSFQKYTESDAECEKENQNQTFANGGVVWYKKSSKGYNNNTTLVRNVLSVISPAKPSHLSLSLSLVYMND